MKTLLYRFLAFSLVAAVLTGLQWPGADAINLAPRSLQRATRQTGHNHGASAVHAEEEAEECPLNASLLTLAFNEVAVEMNVTGLNGTLCSLPIPECDHHDDDDHADGDHGDKHKEDHDGSGSALTDPHCLSIYNVCKELMAHTNLTTDSCLDRVCEEEHNATDTSRSSDRPSKAEAYGYGFLMVMLVSLGSLLGIFVVPLIDTNKNKRKNKKQSKKHIVYKYIYFFMIALGTSALLTDAVLHLIPHAWGLHDHEEDEHNHSSSHGTAIEDFVWKGSVTLLAVYLFYLMEYGLHYWSSHSHSHGFPFDEDNGPHSETIMLDVTVPHSPCLPDHHDGHIIHPGQANGEREREREMESGRGSREAFLREKVEEREEEEGDVSSSASSSKGFNGLTPAPEELPKKSEQPKKCSWLLQIKPLAWLIILGDGLHNFADGLALGAAISQSLALGISTTIALLFHEIPHEFGDYVILLSTGLSWYSALLFNFFSALTAVIGFFIGVAIGTESETVNNWILAFAAGSFIYIALVDLLPELIHSKERGPHRCGLFLAGNLGFYISFLALFLLAVYEEDLNNLISE